MFTVTMSVIVVADNIDEARALADDMANNVPQYFMSAETAKVIDVKEKSEV